MDGFDCVCAIICSVFSSGNALHKSAQVVSVRFIPGSLSSPFINTRYSSSIPACLFRTESASAVAAG